MTRTVVALFDSFSTASAAVRELAANGFDRDTISLVASDAAREYEPYLMSDVDEVNDAAATGAGIGAVIGGLGGLLVGLGALAIPGIGPVVAAGPLAAAISGLVGAGAGAVLGGAAGGLVGALVDLGVPEEQAGYFTEGVRRGGALVTVQTDATTAGRAVEILNGFDPVNIDERVRSWRERGWTEYNPGAQAYTVEEIQAERRRYYDTDYSDDFYTYSPTFRNHYNTTYFGTRYGYDDYLPGYYYGYSLGTDERYRDREWDEIEPEVRRNWEREHPDSAWENFKDSVRYAWEEVKDAVR